MPCSGLKSATSCTPGALCSRSIVVAPLGGAAGVVGDEADALALEQRRSRRARARRCPAAPVRPVRRRADGCDAPKSVPVMPAGRRGADVTARPASRSPPSRGSRGNGRDLAAQRRHVALAVGMQAAREKDDVAASTTGSIQSDVPVKPVCPNEPMGNSSPRFDENGESMSQPRPRTLGMPAGVAGVVIFATVGGDSTRTSPSRPPSEQHAREARQIARRAEQPGVPGHAAHAPRGRIVHDAAQRRRIRACCTARPPSCRSARSARCARASPPAG